MTTLRILFERPDGGITVRTPAPKGRRAGESEHDWLERVAAKNPKGRRLPNREVRELPDPAFQAAWRANPDGTLRVDAVEKERIQQEREAAALEELSNAR